MEDQPTGRQTSDNYTISFLFKRDEKSGTVCLTDGKLKIESARQPGDRRFAREELFWYLDYFILQP